MLVLRVALQLYVLFVLKHLSTRVRICFVHCYLYYLPDAATLGGANDGGGACVVIVHTARTGSVL